MFSYRRARRSSTRVDSPPPTSMIDAGRPPAARSIRAREVSRCDRYQLTASATRARRQKLPKTRLMDDGIHHRQNASDAEMRVATAQLSAKSEEQKLRQSAADKK
jgi:hypothetical protein